MRLRGINVSRWGCDTVPHPRQTDSTSCGPFVLKVSVRGWANYDLNKINTLSVSDNVSKANVILNGNITVICHI